MANLDRCGVPLPLSYIRQQEELQKQIVARARELDMRPILPAFAGHVPPELALDSRKIFADGIEQLRQVG